VLKLIRRLLATLVGQPNSAIKLFKAWVCYQIWLCASVYFAAKFGGVKVASHLFPRVFVIVVLALAAKQVSSKSIIYRHSLK
jgi:hypothetical protein